MLRVAGPRLAHLVGERAEVQQIRAVTLRCEFALASRRNRHAQIATAYSLRLELPSRELLQLRRVEPQRIRIGDRALEVKWLVVVNDVAAAGFDSVVIAYLLPIHPLSVA